VKRAQIHLLQQPNKAREAAAFTAGLEACGYTVHERIAEPTPDDVFLSWNRMGAANTEARRFEAAKARVIVAENGYLGAVWSRPGRWFAMALGHHNGAGRWPVGGPERWESWGVEMDPMRTIEFYDDTPRFNMIKGGVMLAQRGIGEPALRPPERWTEQTARSLGFRIRRHPGISQSMPLLFDDLRGVSVVATWSSGAALKAMLLGVHVIHGMPGWIGAQASTPFGSPINPHDRRLAMFRRLAWAMWHEEEAAAGVPFRRLLEC
jgi:hypothetical protein